MMKKQVAEAPTPNLYPIPHVDMVSDFSMLKDFDDSDITFLKRDYMRNLPETDPTRYLMDLHARQYLEEQTQQRRSYRAGVIAGSIILRSRLYAIDLPPGTALEGEPQNEVEWGKMQLSRFALRQYFKESFDVKKHLYETVELPWAQHQSEYVPGERQRNDWMAVGMGDMLRIGDVAEAHVTDQKIRHPLISPLKHEPLLDYEDL